MLLIAGCEDDTKDTTPPGVISNLSFVPTYGGAIISYELPNDEDVLFVKAEYTTTIGDKILKVSSRYNNSIEIDGFNDTIDHTIDLYTVDQEGNHSDKVNFEVKPLKSFIYLVKESLSIEAALGGVKVKWVNPEAKPVNIYIYAKNLEENIEYEFPLSSKSSADSASIKNLQATDYEFSCNVRDLQHNETEKEYFATLKPLFEEKIDKGGWTLDDALSVDGTKWEGVTENFWDDVIDTKESSADNSYFIINRDDNGGSLSYPLDIVIELNKNIIMSRFVVWQRAFWYLNPEQNGVSEDYYYYQNENMRSFELYSSNDKTEWTLIGEFDIGDPRDVDGNVSSDKIEEAMEGHEFELPAITAPFKYLKFSITSNFGSETNCYGSEITLYGIDNVE